MDQLSTDDFQTFIVHQKLLKVYHLVNDDTRRRL